MNHLREAAIIINDLDSMIHRIENLPAHPKYTHALVAVQAAKEDIEQGRSLIHHADVRERFAKPA